MARSIGTAVAEKRNMNIPDVRRLSNYLACSTETRSELVVLIRSGEAIQTLKDIKVVVLDKTGTITEGKPAVTHIVTAKKPDGTPIAPADVLKWAASVEQRSEHPLAHAILKAAQDKQVALLPVEKFAAMEGRGVRGTVDRRIIEVISLRHARERSLELGTLGPDADRLAAQGRSPVIVVVNNTVYAVIAISDPIKPTSKAAIALLKRKGLPVVMVSGDSRKGAEAVAAEVGIDEVIAEVLPSQKADLVKKLQHQSGAGDIVMVGDGINDAPALAQARVGIAMGTGTDVAMESAGVTLVKGDLRGIARARRLSHRTMSNIRQNLFFAFIYNAIGIPIAAGVLYPVFGLVLSPMIAAGAMAASSLSVVSNANRLRRFRVPEAKGVARPSIGDVRVEIGEREPTKQEATMETVHDPVCGMDIDPADAAGTEDYEGKTYYFCSKSCHEKFKAEPQKYAS